MSTRPKMPSLARRNTVHQHHSGHVEVYDIATTNPFLNSSSEETVNHSPVHPSFSRPSDRTLQGTNPFTYTPTLYLRDKNDPILPLNPNSNASSQQPNDRSRRMSLDALKAPFSWNRHRRATCTASAPVEAKRLSTPRSQSIFGYSEQDVETVPEEEILKSALYHDATRLEEGQEGRHVYLLPEGRSTSPPPPRASQNAPRPVSHNPFLQDDLHIHPLDQGGDATVSDSLERKTNDAEVTPVKFPARRRHSVFSDWSIEDCPQLLTTHKQQESQRLQQQHHQQGDPKDMSASRSALTRSVTMNSYPDEHQPQHRRHSSAAANPPPSSFSNYRARRNNATLGRTMTMNGAGYQSPQRLQDSDPWQQRNQDIGAVYTDDGAFAYVVDNRPAVADDITHGLDRDQPAATVKRPGTMGPLRRRESCSYAQDFSSPSRHTITRPPRPWVNTGTTRSTSLKSFGSQYSPLHQSSFVHDNVLEDNVFVGRSVAHVRALSKPYRDVQLRPYGQEFEDEEDEEQEEGGEFAKESGAHGRGGDQDHAVESGSRSAIEDDQIYYNTLARQLTRHPYDEEEGFDIHRDGHDQGYSLSVYNRKESILGQSDGSLTKGFQASFYKLMTTHPSEEDDDPDATSGSRSFRSRLGGVDASSFSFTGSAHSFTSSFRARVRLTRTKTVLRQIKKKISIAARSVMTEASKATQSVGPLLSRKRSSSHASSRARLNVPIQERPVDEHNDEYNSSYYDEDAEPYYDPLAAPQQQESEYGGEHEMSQHHYQEGPVAMDNRQGRHEGHYSFSSAVATR